MGSDLGPVEIGVAVAAGVVLFLFGIEHFSAEIQTVTGARFRRFIAKGTKNRFAGFALGAGVTAVIQSSTATSVITVGLVNAGVLTFRQSLGLIFGSNVGTTITAQLVALKLTDFAPALILVGFLTSLLPFKWRVFGRSIFYFGLVFFSLELVSAAAAPIRENPTALELIRSLDGPIIAVLIGALFTAIVQSSTVTTGVAIVLLAEDAITLQQALPLVIGANVGTTVTSLIAASRFDTSARRTAVSHALYNIVGALAFLPLLGILESFLRSLSLSGASALATAHLLFNVTVAALFLLALSPFEKLVMRLVRDDADEETPVRALDAEKVQSTEDGASEVRAWAAEVISVQLRGYTAAVLAIETRDKSIESRARRTSAIVEHAIAEASELIKTVAHGELAPNLSEAVLKLVVTIDHTRQLQDSLIDLLEIYSRLERQNRRFSVDSLLEVQAVYPEMAKLLEKLAAFVSTNDQSTRAALIKHEAKLERSLQKAYRNFLQLVQRLEERGELADFLSIHQRLSSKVHAFGRYIGSSSAVPPPLEH